MNNFFLIKHNYISLRTTLKHGLHDIDSSLVSRSSDGILKEIFFQDKRFIHCTNRRTLIASIKYIKNTKRFKQFLF